MKIFDVEDISASVDRVVQLCQTLEDERNYQTALTALAALSCMKLLIGPEKFEGLPAFSRWLKLANDIVNEDTKKELDKKEE